MIVISPRRTGLSASRVPAALAWLALAAAGSAAAADDKDELEAVMSGNTVDAEAGAHDRYEQGWKSEEVVLRLAPLEEVEVKAVMAADNVLLYSWEADEPVYVDAHGEPQDYPDSPAVRYEERDGVSSGHGRLTAPVDGRHGWYWLNTNETEITIRLRVAGWYESVDEVFRQSP